jgi:branched-chain amino acid transport system ATP-binding protein
LRLTWEVEEGRQVFFQMRNIRLHYGKAEVLKGISLEIEQGSVCTLIGSNGAGKSSILRTISGLDRPTAGEIWFQGIRTDKMPPHDIVKLGIIHIPERRRLFTPMTVIENIELGAYCIKNRREIARGLENVYEHFPILKQRRNQIAGTLSGGEQQMLAIGRALMANPKLLLLDEPSIGLSPLLVKEVDAIIRTINRGGISIILVEQNALMALRVADKAYVLEIGNIVMQGNPESLIINEDIRRAYLGE